MKNSIKVKFPKLNKNNTIAKNDHEIENGSYVENCIVRYSVTLDDHAWKAFSNGLLDDHAFIGDNVGGTIFDEDTERFFEENGDDYFFICNYLRDNPETKKWMDVIRVSCGEEVVFVNPEGYKYARYVGRIVE